MRLHQDLTPRKWSKQERCGKVMRVAPFRVCHSLLVKGGIMVWSPDTYSCGYCRSITLWYFVVVVASARIKVPKDRGMTYSCSSYLVTEVTRPCVGRDLTVTLVSRDVPPEAIPCGSRKFLSLTICWKSIHPIRALYGFSCRTCHLTWQL